MRQTFAAHTNILVIATRATKHKQNERTMTLEVLQASDEDENNHTDSLFTERKEVLHLIRSVLYNNNNDEISSTASSTVNKSELNISNVPSDVLGTIILDEDIIPNLQQSLQKKWIAYERIRTILDQYLECPSLLDGSIRIIVDTLIEPILSTILATTNNNDDTTMKNQTRHITTTTIIENMENLENIDYPMQQSSPASLTDDRTFDASTSTSVSSLLAIRYGLSILYLLSKVRGRKCIAKFLPHNVNHIEPVWTILQEWIKTSNSITTSATTNDNSSSICMTINNNNKHIPPLWESIYVLWMWMSLLSLVPFDVKKIIHNTNTDDDNDNDNDNYSMNTTNTSSTGTNNLSFMNLLINFCQEQINDPGPNRDVVASCLAHWLARPDPNQEQYVQLFVQWSLSNINIVTNTNTTGCITGSNNHTNTVHNSRSLLFISLGILQVSTTIIKVSSINRKQLLSYLQPLWDPLLVLSEYLDDILVIQKLLVKWWTRMCTLYLPPRIALWRYQRGTRSLQVTLPSISTQQQQQQNDIVIKEKKHTLVTQSSDDDDGIVDDDIVENDLEILVPDVVEDAVGLIINSLSHSSTIVRWAAAKGIGRITERLPKLCADDILDAILELFYDDEYQSSSIMTTTNAGKNKKASKVTSDQCWHGGCLALAELARRGLLLPYRLPDVVPYIIRAVQYDVQRGGGVQSNGSTSSSVGSHVRDAGCYTYWAFARAYDANTLRPYIRELSEAILVTSLFDREVNCRRAASAAFQESVGRQGATNFPHGIDIITTADYFSLGNRSYSYIHIVPKIACLDHNTYMKPITLHLCTIKLFHWDETIRILSSKSIHNITSLSVEYVGTYILSILLHNCLDEKNLHVRHGALLGVAEIIYALALLDRIDIITEQTRDDLINLVPNIEKKRLYRGRGGESMRSAVCRFIECLCSVRFQLQVKDQVSLLDSIDAIIPHPKEDVQAQACVALESLLTEYFPVKENGPTERLQGRVVDKFLQQLASSDNPAIVRGYAMALGHIPLKLVAPSFIVLQSIIVALSKTSKYDNVVGGEGDAESRRNSLQSLLKIYKIVGFNNRIEQVEKVPTYPRIYLDESLYLMLMDTFFLAMDDYRSDRRGDVGSWCRIEGINGLTTLILDMNNAMFLSPSERETYGTKTVAFLLKQLVEKLDTLRYSAGISIVLLLLNSESCQYIRHCQQLLDCFGLSAQNREPHQKEETLNNSSSNNKNNMFDSTLCKWDEIDWVFSSVTAIAHINETLYFENIILGLVLSIGGLTESVSVAAQSALIQWTKGATIDRLTYLGQYMSCLLEQYRGIERYTYPTLKAMNVLLIHQCFDRLITTQSTTPMLSDSLSPFCTTCIENIILEEKVCHKKNVKHLFAIVDIICSFVSVLSLSNDNNNNTTNEEKKQCLSFLCWMTSHPFPRVRTYTAEQFYITLVSTAGSNESSSIGNGGSTSTNTAEDLLLTSPWGTTEELFVPIAVSSILASYLNVSKEFQHFSV